VGGRPGGPSQEQPLATSAVIAIATSIRATPALAAVISERQEALCAVALLTHRANGAEGLCAVGRLTHRANGAGGAHARGGSGDPYVCSVVIPSERSESRNLAVAVAVRAFARREPSTRCARSG